MTTAKHNCAFPQDAPSAAKLYLAKNLAPIPVPLGSKDPGYPDWPRLRVTSENLDRYFPLGKAQNVGILNGAPSDDEVDVDLDCQEARLIAPRFLPPTRWIFGRKSSPRSHWIYRTDLPLNNAQIAFHDLVPNPDGSRAVLLELRGTGGHTIYPPSTHRETGERIEWDQFDDTEPARLALDDLRQAVGELAAAALLARYWPSKGARDMAPMALSGGLVRAGWTEERVSRFVSAVAEAAGDEEIRMRAGKAEPTNRTFQDGEKVTGWPTFAKLIGQYGEKVVQRVREWLGLTGQANATDPEFEAWEPPVEFGKVPEVPPFPVECFAGWLGEWVVSEATATQTPPDLAAMITLGICGAGLARKFRIRVRDGWTEPTNIFTVTAMLSGERKSAVLTDAMVPVLAHEQEEIERMEPIIAAAASDHRMLEARLKEAEKKAAKTKDADEQKELQDEARELAKELDKHRIPDKPMMFTDDCTPEKLSNLIAHQGGRMLQASAEGTAIEICKGRYSESSTYDVYLKGHSGDPLRVGRVTREGEMVDQPALSVVLAVQPDVINGLAERTDMRGRGYLARWLYCLPASKVGRRDIRPNPVPPQVADLYHTKVLALWRLEGGVDGLTGEPAPIILEFSAAGDRAIEDFQRWLEPQLAEDKDLCQLAGWANKLAGAIARLAGILHVAANARDGKVPTTISEQTVRAAIRIGRDYQLPHAQAALQSWAQTTASLMPVAWFAGWFVY